jgi:hypothetical protein
VQLSKKLTKINGRLMGLLEKTNTEEKPTSACFVLNNALEVITEAFIHANLDIKIIQFIIQTELNCKYTFLFIKIFLFLAAIHFSKFSAPPRGNKTIINQSLKLQLNCN